MNFEVEPHVNKTGLDFGIVFDFRFFGSGHRNNRIHFAGIWTSAITHSFGLIACAESSTTSLTFCYYIMSAPTLNGKPLLPLDEETLESGACG